MNDQPINSPRDENEGVSRLLRETAEQTSPTQFFASELQEQLKDAHKPKSGRRFPAVTQPAATLGWAVLAIILVLALNWSIRKLVPEIQPASDATPTGFTCPVTQPNGETPPGEQAGPDYLGTGQIWTGLWPDGRVLLTPQDRNEDGSFSMKWWWWLKSPGEMTIEGRRLDAQSEPLSAYFSGGYNEYGVVIVALTFPTTGCWEVTGRAGDSSLTFVTEVVFNETSPTPEAVIEENATPVANNQGYDWRGTKLFLNAPLPDGPSQASIHLLNEEQPGTFEDARRLADTFGISGELYKIPSHLNNGSGYLATDGKQRLYIESATHYMYYADYGTFSFQSGDGNMTTEQARTAVDAFLDAHNMDIDYRIEHGPQIPGLFYVLPLASDGLTVRHDYNMPSRYEFTIDPSGRVIVFASSRVAYDTLGSYGIRSAEEAFQMVLEAGNELTNGVLESSRSGGIMNEKYWERQYPDDQTVTIYGQPLFYPAAEAGGEPFTAIGQYTAIGNIAGLEKLDTSTPIRATGRFTVQGGVRRFIVESLDAAPLQETFLSGYFRRDGDQTVLASFDGGPDYVIEDAPPDLPLNTTRDEYLSVNGFLVDGKMNWIWIQYLPSGIGGGGGGGAGSGFYKLNLSGTPVPFPTPAPIPFRPTSIPGNTHVVSEGDTCAGIASSFMISVEELIALNNLSEDCLIALGQTLVLPSQEAPYTAERWEGQRGILSITIWEKADGSQRVQYGFISSNPEFPYLLLEGDGLDALQQYNSRPVDVWGTVGTLNEDRMPVLKVERFEVPFPDLQFEILKGVEQSIEVNGQTALLFTAESGRQSVELAPNCYDIIGPESVSGTGQVDQPILLEALAVPGLTFGGYPAICVFSTSLAVDPQTNQPLELISTAGEISILPEPSAGLGNAPTLTIENVELAYYIPDPRYRQNAQAGAPAYIQPVWRFYGHYSTGDEFEFLVQALKLEYLLPELVPQGPPG